MKNFEDIYKKVKDLQNSEESLNQKISFHKNFALGNLGIYGVGIFFPPLKLVSYATIAGLFCYRKFYLEKKIYEMNEKEFEISNEIEKYYEQNSFLKKLSKSIDEHYKEIYKEYKFNKEEDICRQIKLNSKEQMDATLIKKLKEEVNKLYKMNEDNHYNILLLGRSGVGKSTLINVVLDLKGDKAAKENAVKPEIEVFETGLEEYEKKYIPMEYKSDKSSLVLLDSRGIELSKNYNIEIAMKHIKEFIEERNGLNAEPDKFIHCIWYLVKGDRFEDTEGEYIKSLKNIYNNLGLPIIFVYTKALDEGDKFKKRIEECIGEENINFIPIISRDIEIKTGKSKTIIPSFGVFDEDDGLIQLSFKLAKNSLKSSYFNYMKNLLKSIYVNDINLKSYLNTNYFIVSKIKAVIYEREKTLEEIRNNFEKEFLDIIKLFLVDEEIPEYKEENSKLIKQFFNCFPNLNDNKLVSLVNELEKKETESLFGNYMDKNLKAEKEYGIKCQQGKEEIKEMLSKDIIDPIKSLIPNIALSYILLKYMGILCDNLNKRLLEDFEESYKRIENQTSEELKSIVNKVYDNIIKKCWFKNDNDNS